MSKAECVRQCLDRYVKVIRSLGKLTRKRLNTAYLLCLYDCDN
jgi:hypothetical protein